MLPSSARMATDTCFCLSVQVRNETPPGTISAPWEYNLFSIGHCFSGFTGHLRGSLPGFGCPGFFSRKALFTLGKLQQAHASVDQFDFLASRGHFVGFDKTPLFACVEKQFPPNLFASRQDKR